MATGVVPTAIGELFGSVNNTLLLESREPSKNRHIVWWFHLNLPPGPTSGAVVFGNVVFLKIGVASATGLFSLMVALFCSAKGDAGNAVNPPFPSPLKTEMVFVPLIRHRKIQIAIAIEIRHHHRTGLLPCRVWRPCRLHQTCHLHFPSNTVTLFEVELAITKSTGATVTPARVDHRIPKRSGSHRHRPGLSFRQHERRLGLRRKVAAILIQQNADGVVVGIGHRQIPEVSHRCTSPPQSATGLLPTLNVVSGNVVEVGSDPRIEFGIRSASSRPSAQTSR